MSEPLNQTTQAAWPEWHRQPLRLTISEINNPTIVIDQFFQCYHLPDIRDCLTSWLRDSLAKESIECKQHIATHDFVQKLIEAIWLIYQNDLQVIELTGNQYNKKSELIADTNSENGQQERYSKPERLVEKAAKHPMEVLTEAFTHISVMDLRDDLLPNWLRVANISDVGVYDFAEDREILHEFFDQLNLLIEALLIIKVSGGSTASDPNSLQQITENLPKHNKPKLLSKEQCATPMLVVTDFFQQFNIDYVRRELWDLLDAGIGLDGTYPDGFSPWIAFYTYNNVISITEAGYHLCKEATSGKRKQ